MSDDQVRAREGEPPIVGMIRRGEVPDDPEGGIFCGVPPESDEVRAREAVVPPSDNDLRQISPQVAASSSESRQPKRRLTVKQRTFLAAYPLTATINGAADAAGVARCRHYEWLKTSPDYKAAFAEAVDEAAEKLEDAARNRAVEGLKRYRFTKGGDPILHPTTGEPYYEHVYSDVLLIFLLKGLRPDKYRENLRVENAGAEQVRVVFDPNWYGNNAHDHAAAAAPAPTPDPAV